MTSTGLSVKGSLDVTLKKYELVIVVGNTVTWITVLLRQQSNVELLPAPFDIVIVVFSSKNPLILPTNEPPYA